MIGLTAQYRALSTFKHTALIAHACAAACHVLPPACTRMGLCAGSGKLYIAAADSRGPDECNCQVDAEGIGCCRHANVRAGQLRLLHPSLVALSTHMIAMLLHIQPWRLATSLPQHLLPGLQYSLDVIFLSLAVVLAN